MSYTIGARVRHLRAQRGLSQADLAGSELSASYISLIEAGKRVPSERTLELLSARLDCAPDELYDAVLAETDLAVDFALAEAEWALADGRPEAALELFGEAGRLAVAASNPERVVQARWGRARSLEGLTRLGEALDVYTDLLESAQPTSAEPPGRLEVVRALCRCVAELGDFNRVIEIGEAALREFEELGPAPSVPSVEIMCEVVRAHLLRGEALWARTLTEAAVGKAELLRNPHRLASVYQAAARQAREVGRHAEALGLNRKALELLWRADSEAVLGEALALHGMTIRQSDSENLLAAERDLWRAVEIQERAGQSVGCARTYLELARCALIHADGEAALERAGQALSRLKGAPAIERARALVLMAQALAACERPAEALARCDEAVAALGEVVLRSRPVALVWGEAAEVYWALGAAELAAPTWRRGFSLLGQVDPLPATGSDVLDST